jgi:hypothetical protein
MTDKNKDGFLPGQDLTFEDLMKMRAKPVRRLPTREEVLEMDKPEVLEWLEAHGVESPEGDVRKLRKTLNSVLYVGDGE